MDTDSGTLSVSEDINLSKVDIPEVPKDIIFPDELNRFLRDQIRYYVHENGMLQKNLSDSEIKYNECRGKVNELEEKLKNFEKISEGNDILSSTKVASAKIVQLSKKLREKTSEVETLKTKNSKLEQYLYELKQKSDDTKESVSEKEEKPVNELEGTIKKLQEKLNSTSNKLLEVKNINLQIRNDLKLANKWLQQEVGETFESLQTLHNSNGNWRGRAQIICDLQQKNCELKDKLKDFQDKFNGTPGATISLSASKTDNRINNLSKENNELKQNYEELKKKHDALRARYRVLDSDYTLLKSKFAMIKEQSERDQDIISTLSSQISNNRETKNDVLRQKDGIINKMQKEKEILAKEIEEYKTVVKNINEEIEKKNREIENLKSPRPSSSCGIQHSNDKTVKRLEAERMRLLELVEVNNIRLKTERDAHSKTQQLLRFEKQRSAKAEANAARIQLESNSSRSSCYSTTSSSIKPLDFGLRDQLELAEENIKALKTRLDIEQLERKSDLQEFYKILQGSDDEKNLH